MELVPTGKGMLLRVLLLAILLVLPAACLAAPIECRAVLEEANQVRILWNAEPGRSYSLWTTTNFNQPWQRALTEPAVLSATTTELSYSFPASSGGRFFRVELVSDMTNYLEGVSRTSVGRFGGKAGNDNAKLNTLLTFMVDPWRSAGVSLYWPHYAGVANAPKDVPEYGYYTDAYYFGQFGPIVNGTVSGQYSRILEVGWEHMNHELKANNLAYSVQTSLLTPGIQFKLPSHSKLGLFYNIPAAQLGTVRSVAIPTASGIQRFTVDGNDNLSLSLGTSMNEGWILVWFNGAQNWSFDFPCLISVQRRIGRLDIKPGGMDLSFSTAAGAVALMPLYGIERTALSQTQSWVGGGLPDEVLASARFWNQALKAFPRLCQEHYRSRESTSAVDIELRYTYDLIADDWGTEPLYLAPIPPAVGYAAERGYPVAYPTEPVFLVKTLQGPYYALTNAQTAQYTLPAYSGYVNKTYDIWSMPRTTNAALLTQVRGALGTFYDGFLPGWKPQSNPSGADLGQQIYPGILSYPFLQGKQQLLFKTKAATGLSSVVLAASSYTNYVDGVSGKQVPINSHSYNAYGQEIQDADWYHAYALYASWAFAHYFNGWDMIRSNWTTVSTKLLPIFEFSSDWSTQCWWANSQGIGLGAEDINMGFGAMVALARMSQHEGAFGLYNECLYMMAKTALTDYASHFSQGYVDGLKPWRNKDLCLDSDPAAPGDGWSEPFGVQFARYDHSQGLWLTCIAPFNPCWPEVAWLFADTGIKTQAETALNTKLPFYYPNWLTDQNNSMWGNVKILLPILGYLLEREPAALYANINSFYALAPTSANYTPWAYASVIGPTFTNLTAASRPVVETPAGALFYPNAAYGGKAVALPPGNYVLSELQALGMTNDTVSSLKVNPGYTVTLYADDHFSGTSWRFIADTPQLTSGADNATSSLKIEE